MKFLVIIGVSFFSFTLTASSFDNVKHYLYQNGFKYRDAYSGAVDHFISVNQVKVDLGTRLEITNSQAKRLVQSDLEKLNQAPYLKKCGEEILNPKAQRGFVLNSDEFLSNDKNLEAAFYFDFYGILPSCAQLKNCPPHRAKLNRTYACSLGIRTKNTKHSLYEMYFTLDNVGFDECFHHSKELLKLDSRNFLYEIFLDKKSVPYCAINILLRTKK